MNQDTLLVPLSDMHSGSSVALFPGHFWQFQHKNHTPTTVQLAMFDHFLKCADYAREQRKNKRLIIVHDGDAIEGVHHGSHQVLTYDLDEQAAIHAELMDGFLRRAHFSHKNGDRLYYIAGTEAHTGDKEKEIAKDLPAEVNPDGGHVFDHLELEVNGRRVWFTHHGPTAGKGANAGNTMRNWLRDVYWDCVRTKHEVPDVVFTGHTHRPLYNTYVMDFKTVHGIICPSWQLKTRFVYRIGAVQFNEIGAAFLTITAGGDIRTPVVLGLDAKDLVTIKL